MTVRVRLFAILRERAGRGELELELAEGSTVADLMAALAAEPGLEQVLDRIGVRAAVNREYVEPTTVLRADDEVALVPPVSGGTAADVAATITDDPLDPAALTRAVIRPAAGAVVAFQGTTRTVARLEYEAYREMAEERISAILRDCVERHGLEAAAGAHRTGAVALSEPSVVVAVSAAHREQAFAGAREAIDRIKAEAPIWKREVDSDGDGERSEWVEGALPGADAEDTAAGRLTHLDESGRARMVDVSAKETSVRRARAVATVRMSTQTATAVARGDAPKGDVLGTARLAGIQAAKRTWELVPLAHPLELDFVDVEAEVDAGEGVVRLEAEAGTTARTGVEMEAMTACAVAALTVYDMVKGLERGVRIEALELLAKSGGRSGEWHREQS